MPRAFRPRLRFAHLPSSLSPPCRQGGDNWFYSPSAGIRSFAELQDMYETSAGHNTALIVDFAPKPDGSLPPGQVAVAAALGNFVRACYGAPVVQGAGNRTVITLTPAGGPAAVDRVLVSEDQTHGQLVRAFTVSATLANGSAVTLVAAGTSIGNKFIAVLPAPLTVASLTLNVTAIVASVARAGGHPFIKSFAAFSCDAAAEVQRADLQARGFEQPPPSTAAERAAARLSGAAASVSSGTVTERRAAGGGTRLHRAQ